MNVLQPLIFCFALYLLTLALVSLWSDYSDDFHKDGHWFGDAVLLVFWDSYMVAIKALFWLYRRIALPSWLVELPQTFSPDFVRRAGAYAYLRREIRRKGGAK